MIGKLYWPTTAQLLKKFRVLLELYLRYIQYEVSSIAVVTAPTCFSLTLYLAACSSIRAPAPAIHHSHYFIHTCPGIPNYDHEKTWMEDASYAANIVVVADRCEVHERHPPIEQNSSTPFTPCSLPFFVVVFSLAYTPLILYIHTAVHHQE